MVMLRAVPVAVASAAWRVEFASTATLPLQFWTFAAVLPERTPPFISIAFGYVVPTVPASVPLALTTNLLCSDGVPALLPTNKMPLLTVVVALEEYVFDPLTWVTDVVAAMSKIRFEVAPPP